MPQGIGKGGKMSEMERMERAKGEGKGGGSGGKAERKECLLRSRRGVLRTDEGRRSRGDGLVQTEPHRPAYYWKATRYGK